ncbi:MAG TPA: hypothetical protein VMM36_14710 [Opitutaceae bacterium]|nr:hypothetical protein [Opitutaceae bacterium]
MNARTDSPLAPAALLALCVAIVVAGSVWTAWDMFTEKKRPMIQGWDDSHYYFWLPSVVIDRDLDFSNQLEDSGTVTPAARDAGLEQARTPTGLLPNKYPPGWALGSLPFFLAAHVTAPAGFTGFEPRYLVSVWIGQLLIAAAGLWCAVRVVARFFPERTAAIAVLGVWLASPLVYYQSARFAMSHSQVFALAAAAAWIAFRIADGDGRRRTWAMLGFCAAMLLVTRNIAVVYLALPALIVARQLRSWRAATWLAIGAAGPLAVQFVAWKILYGSWLVYTYGQDRFEPAQGDAIRTLFSPWHGWFYWHPFLLAAVVAFVVWAVRRTEGRMWLASLAAIFVLNTVWPVWWFGSSFGHRGFDAATLFAMVGAAALWHATAIRPRLRVALATVACVTIAWNLVMLALFLTQRISREEAVTYGEALRAASNWMFSGR